MSAGMTQVEALLGLGNEPDYLDLNDWILEFHPQVFESTKYLHPSAQMSCWESIWRNELRKIG